MRHHRHNNFEERRSKTAFTIIELLVAVAITAAMAAVMLAMTTNILSSWTRASGNLSAMSNARVALDFLQKDLERAMFRHDGNVWLAVDTINDTNFGNQNILTGGQQISGGAWLAPAAGADRGKPNDAGLGQHNAAFDPNQNRFGWNGVWLRFFVADPEIRAVGYQIVRRGVRGPDGEQRYMLYRGQASALETFQEGYDIVSPGYFLGAGTASQAGRGAPSGSAAEVRRPNAASIVGNNVVDFGVKLFWKAREIPGNPNSPIVYMEIFPDNEVQLAHRSPPLPGNAAQPEDFPNSFPPYSEYSHPRVTDDPANGNASTRIPNVAEIYLRVLTDEGAQLISNYERGLIDGDWWDIVEANSKLFTRRVVLQNAPDSF